MVEMAGVVLMQNDPKTNEEITPGSTESVSQSEDNSGFAGNNNSYVTPKRQKNWVVIGTLVLAVATTISAGFTAYAANETGRMATETNKLAAETKRMADETANLVTETSKAVEVNSRMLEANLVQTKLQYVKSQLDDFKKYKFQYLTDEILKITNEYPPSGWREDYCTKLISKGKDYEQLCRSYFWCNYYLELIDSKYCQAVQALAKQDFVMADITLNEASSSFCYVNKYYEEAKDIINNRNPIITTP
jgi:cell division protein FtsL